MNRSNKLELFLHAELKVSSPINVCRAVGGIPAAETNHFSLSCHPRRSFIIDAKQLSTVVKLQMLVSQFCFCFFYIFRQLDAKCRGGAAHGRPPRFDLITSERLNLSRKASMLK